MTHANDPRVKTHVEITSVSGIRPDQVVVIAPGQPPQSPKMDAPPSPRGAPHLRLVWSAD